MVTVGVLYTSGPSGAPAPTDLSVGGHSICPRTVCISGWLKSNVNTQKSPLREWRGTFCKPYMMPTTTLHTANRIMVIKVRADRAEEICTRSEGSSEKMGMT